jgi:hypothetical protein
MKRIVYSEKLEKSRDLFARAQEGSEILRDLVGNSAADIEAEWDLTNDERGRPLLTLRISDWTGSATTAFSPVEIGNLSHIEGRLNRLWGDLLQVRSHKLLQELQSPGD